MDVRLQRRYWRLVREHVNANPDLAAGPKALQDQCQSFASTQAAWRFLNSDRVTLRQLIEPPREYARRAVAQQDSPYVLLVHDWSKLGYPKHTAKTDQTRLSHETNIGYDLYTALLLEPDGGQPLAPMEVELLCDQGHLSTRNDSPRLRQHHLQQLFPTMQAAREWGLATKHGPAKVVHVIDREADAQSHFRHWVSEGELFLVRADFTRKVDWTDAAGGEHRLSLPDLTRKLAQGGHFAAAEDVVYRGKEKARSVAAVDIRLSSPARRRTAAGRTITSGEPLPLRLVVSRVHSESGKVLATWYLLSNVPGDVSAEQLADWYYRRWQIESFYKLIKSGGQQVESWQQESAEAIAKRLLVASMVCVTAWELERQSGEDAAECRRFLIRLSGRQMKRDQPVTTSALVAGLMILLPLSELLNDYSPEQLQALARQAAPILCRSG